PGGLVYGLLKVPVGQVDVLLGHLGVGVAHEVGQSSVGDSGGGGLGPEGVSGRIHHDQFPVLVRSNLGPSPVTSGFDTGGRSPSRAVPSNLVRPGPRSRRSGVSISGYSGPPGEGGRPGVSGVWPSSGPCVSG